VLRHEITGFVTNGLRHRIHRRGAGPIPACRQPQSLAVAKEGSAMVHRYLSALGVLIAVSVTAQVLPTLPQKTVDTTYPAMSGTTRSVAAGGDFQSALNQAQSGDTIVLQAGATFTGSFTLPAKSGTGWIIVRTSAADSSLPPQGTRLTPSSASVLPKIVTSNSAPAIQTAAGAHHYRFVGVEITVANGVSQNFGLVTLGTDSQSASEVPSFIVLDRVYIHGTTNGNVSRGVALNSASSAIIDSYISEAHFAGFDAQAICGWNGPGPFKIQNNYLSGAGENVLFGGDDPSITNLVPSDIEIVGNYFFKPTSWQSSNWTVKNLLELKNAQRVRVDGNVLEHNWPAAQNGYSILFTVRNQNGSAPWSVVQDVTFTHNIVRHLSSAINILGNDDLQRSQQTKRLLIANNVFEDVSGVNWGGFGRLVQVLDGAANVTIDHNTAFQSGEIIVASGTANSGFTYTNNITPHNQNGVAGDNHYGDPPGALSTYFPGALFRRNVLQGGTASKYPADNFFPATMSAVGFVNQAGGDYHLASSSAYSNAGTDGEDLGADIDGVNRATAGAVNGTTTTPPPSDTTPPAVAITAPASGATVSGTTNITATATDNVGVAGVQFYLDGVALSGEDTSSSYAAAWDTTKSTNGSHTVSAVARDAAGNRTTSAGVTVTVSNSAPPPPDTTAPVVSISAPANGATVSGTTNVTATASDNVGVVGVQFYLDGNALGSEDTSSSYATAWDTTKSANGSHALSAVARDAAGNRKTSASVTVTVSNPVSVESPFNGTPFSVPGQFEAEDFDRGGEGVAYHDNVAGNAGGQYRTAEDVDIISPYTNGFVINNFETGEWMKYAIDVAPAGTYKVEALVSSMFANAAFHIEIDGVNKTGSVTAPNTGAWTTFQWAGVSGVSIAGGQHILRIVADMQYFNVDRVRLTLEAAADTTPPAVSVSAPAAGSTVRGSVNVTANASDNVGVAGVKFFVDGVVLGTELTAPPYVAVWDTTKSSNASHSLTAVARDSAGNTKTSTAVSVTVANGSTPFSGAPYALPGQIEAENFDRGGEGLAYHDNVAGNAGGLYRTSEDVDIISPYANGYVVNNFETGEWLVYTVSVAQAGSYNFQLRVSSMFANSRFHLEVDGVNVSGSTTVPNTGAWTTFTSVPVAAVDLTAGTHVLKVVSDQQYFNLDAISATMPVVQRQRAARR